MPALELIAPRAHDLGGGFTVKRLLPSAQRQAVGPFVFFDHFGPVTAYPGDKHDVRPHPHIGLATLTWLFEGAMVHRDSTGAVQRIEPGAVNWMTAGRGIVHSERTPDDLRDQVRTSHGLQLWIALPEAHEEDAPSFQHVPADAIPVLRQIDGGPGWRDLAPGMSDRSGTPGAPGVTVRVLVGQAWGRRSPVATWSPTLYLEIDLPAGAALDLPDFAAELDPGAQSVELALYGVDAGFDVDGTTVPAHQLAVLPRHSAGAAPLRVRAGAATRVMLVGGVPLGRRFIVWNFVSSHKERIVQARQDWVAQRFDAVPGETEFIPLPPG
jgi:redox-sensitive bicupin YhaK (pirin superfamily)